MRFSSLLAMASAAAASSLTPPVLPLLVRNPYLSTWLGNARDPPWERWPMFWTGANVGLSIMASLPDTHAVLPLLGRPHDSLRYTSKLYNVSTPTYEGATFDASTTNLTYRIDGPDSADEPLRLTLSFLSPITPASTLRQSIPAAYLTIYVEGNFDIDVYIDVNGEWVSGNRDNDIEWEFSRPAGSQDGGSSIKTWKVKRRTEQLLTEFSDRSEWGTLYFTGPADVHHQCGTSAILRQHFAETGGLKNEVDRAFRRIMDDEPVFAFSKSFKLGSRVDSQHLVGQDSVVFTLGLMQDPVVQFASARGLTYMRPLWASHFASADELTKYHYADFLTAKSLAQNYSDQLAVDAYASGSQDYQDIAALSARQVLGATQFSGTPENPILFLKEISSNGNFQTVDVIFPAFPFFLYTNPRWLAYLLEPLLEHQLSGQYPNQYSMHDLGYHFPNATGHSDGNDEYMPVEECGNMLIMGLALVNALRYNTQPAFASSAGEHARSLPNLLEQATGNMLQLATDQYGMDQWWNNTAREGPMEAEKWVSRSYTLWKQWTGYLVRESLIPHNQLCTDDFAGWLANQTNLALKGIVGIRAMSEIASVLGKTEDADHYLSIANDYIEKWQGFGISRDGTHAKLAYTWYGSWTTLYNLYADALLCFHIPDEDKSSAARGIGVTVRRLWQNFKGNQKQSVFIPDKVYSMQSSWYHAVLQRYGLPLDSRHLYTKLDWEFFAAAVTGRKTREAMLQSIALWVNETATDRPLTDLYDTEGNGGFPGLSFMARPVVGGNFAFLALERACGGQAVGALNFLNEETALQDIDVSAALSNDVEGGRGQMEDL